MQVRASHRRTGQSQVPAYHACTLPEIGRHVPIICSILELTFKQYNTVIKHYFDVLNKLTVAYSTN